MIHDYQHIYEEEESMSGRQPRMLLRRSLVIALYVSFLACLASLWAAGILPDNPVAIWQPVMLQHLAQHRLLVLGLPFLCLVLCYGFLRQLAGEIMTGAERHLDERQRLLRTQTHRTAYQLTRVVVLLVPALFFLAYIPWFLPQSSPPPVFALHPSRLQLIDSVNTVQGQFASHLVLLKVTASSLDAQIAFVVNDAPTPTQPGAGDLALAGGLLLVALFLLISALPLSVFVWRGES